MFQQKGRNPSDPTAPQNHEPQGHREEGAGPVIPPRPDTTPGYELGELLVTMISRYGEEQRLPEAMTSEIFKTASPGLTVQVSPERLGEIAFMAMMTVDANAHLNEGWTEAGTREQLIRRFAENMLKDELERNAAA